MILMFYIKYDISTSCVAEIIFVISQNYPEHKRSVK